MDNDCVNGGSQSIRNTFALGKVGTASIVILLGQGESYVDF